jgi:hypothetical protein
MTQATDLLKELATVTPGLPPGVIARDPLFTVPLAQDADYRALSRSLESQIAALSLH